MKLPIGSRLPHDFAEIPTNDPEVIQRNRAVYRITELLSETAWSSLYRGKKVFRNFEFAKGTLTEAADDECLDVLIRTLSYPQTDDREYIKARREHSWFEAKQVLGCRRTNQIAEPLDYLEIRNDQDQFAFSRPGNIPKSEPVLVFESIHGDDLECWRNSASVDVVRVIQVLAQTLDFLDTLHDAKFLLNVVSPAAFWVDELDRVHFLGTENVVDDRRAATWRKLFPTERYVQGFLAPELLQPDSPPTRQSDLYGWSALTWQVLTGESSAKIASDQLQRWARFEPGHRERLRRELVRLTPDQVAYVRQLLKVQGTRFELLWPDSFLDGLWSCLDVNPAQRPATVEDLRAWWGNPPPPSVSQFLAVRQANGITRFAFSTAGQREGTHFKIIRKVAQAPQSSEDGEIVWEGVAGQRIEVRLPPVPGAKRGSAAPGDWFFSIFAMETNGGEKDIVASLKGLFDSRVKNLTPSRPTVAIAVDGTIAGFRHNFANSIHHSSKSLPEEIALLAEVDPLEIVAAELLDSPETQIRGWAIALLERGSPAGVIGVTCRKLLEERGLVDTENEIRQQAASVLIRKSSRLDVAMIVDLAQRIGGRAVDDMIRSARGFLAFGVSAGLIDQSIDALELQHRVINCKVCQQELRARELDQHLTTEHHFVPLDGTLLPFGQALTRLWSRVLQHFDKPALQLLTSYLQKRHPQTAASAFGSALSQQVMFSLQSQLIRHSDDWKQAWLGDLAICLQSNQIAGSACLLLLGHDDARIRFLARGVVINVAVSRLVQVNVTPAVFRDAVDTLVPLSLVNERIEVCRRLVELGANRIAGESCERELDLDRLMDCPECGATFPKREIPRHRRNDHQVFEWDGQRYDWDGLISLLISRTVAVEPDAFAARSLLELLKEKYGTGAWTHIFERIKQELLQSTHEKDFTDKISGLSTAVGTLSVAPVLSRTFMNDDHWACQAAGLAIFSSLERVPPADVSFEAARLLGRSEIPLAICEKVMVHLLRQSSQGATVCHKALLSLASRATDKLEGIGLLRTLEQWVGPSAAIDGVCNELSATIRMRCPRCDVIQTPTELADHVRTQHGLVLVGRTVRQPWSVVMDYLDEYAENPKSYLLERAEQLVDFASPKKGRLKLWRETLRRGIAPPQYRNALVESVTNTTDSLCPECWEAVPASDELPNDFHVDEQGNIESKVASLKQMGMHGIWRSVEITPWNGPTPPWKFSRWGAVATVGLLFFVPSIVCWGLVLQGIVAAKSLAAMGFFGGLIGMTLVALFYKPTAIDPFDVAWEYVVPALIEENNEALNLSQSGFLANLARASLDRGSLRNRQPILRQAIHLVKRLVRQHVIPTRHLNELWYLRLDDASHSNDRHGAREDVLKELLTQFLEGDLSLNFGLRFGLVLERLHREELISAVWYVMEQSRAMGFVAGDLVELFRKSSILKTLGKAVFLRPETIPFYFAVIEMEQAGRIPHGLVSTSQLISAGKFSGLTGKSGLLARSKSSSHAAEVDAISLRAGELEFRNCLFTSSPDVSVREKTTFVPTGWTHQRVDGQPDQRFNQNPPVGYDAIVGYTLKVGGKSWEYEAEPTVLAGRIRTAASFVFGELPLLADKLAQQPCSEHFTKILNGPGVCCPHCQIPLKLHAGAIAERQK